MKVIRYKIKQNSENTESEKDLLLDVELGYSAENEVVAKTESYNGEYEIVDDGQPEPEPNELEKLRADLDFISVMTGVNL